MPSTRVWSARGAVQVFSWGNAWSGEVPYLCRSGADDAPNNDACLDQMFYPSRIWWNICILKCSRFLSNKVERRIAPLSRYTVRIILPFNKFGFQQNNRQHWTWEENIYRSRKTMILLLGSRYNPPPIPLKVNKTGPKWMQKKVRWYISELLSEPRKLQRIQRFSTLTVQRWIKSK